MADRPPLFRRWALGWARRRFAHRLERELAAYAAPQVRMAPLFGFGRGAVGGQTYRSLVVVNVFQRPR